jgi:translation initiation factor 3 subunit B
MCCYSVTICSDDEDLLHNEDIPELEMGFANIIVVDNLPVVPPEKYEKLENVVRKIYSQIGVIKEGGLWMPTHPETQKTYGYCFIEYNTPQVFCFFPVAFIFLPA